MCLIRRSCPGKVPAQTSDGWISCHWIFFFDASVGRGKVEGMDGKKTPPVVQCPWRQAQTEDNWQAHLVILVLLASEVWEPFCPWSWHYMSSTMCSAQARRNLWTYCRDLSLPGLSGIPLLIIEGWQTFHFFQRDQWVFHNILFCFSTLEGASWFFIKLTMQRKSGWIIDTVGRKRKFNRKINNSTCIRAVRGKIKTLVKHKHHK